MDEPKLKIGSDTVLKGYDCDTSLKKTPEEKAKETPEKTNSDVCRNKELTEPLNTHGADKEFETHDNVTSSVLKSPASAETQENDTQKTSASTENLFSELDFKDNEHFGHCSEECDVNKTESEVHASLGSGENINSNTHNSIKSNVSVCKESQAQCILTDNTGNLSKSHLILSIESDKKCDVTDLSGNNENEIESSVRNNDEENQQANVSTEEGVFNPTGEKSSGTESSEKLFTGTAEVGPLRELKNDNESNTVSKEITDEIKSVELPEKKSCNEYLSDLKDTETPSTQDDTKCNKTPEVTDQQSGETNKECENKDVLGSLMCSDNQERSVENQFDEKSEEEIENSSEVQSKIEDKQKLQNEEVEPLNITPFGENSSNVNTGFQEEKSEVSENDKCTLKHLETSLTENEKEDIEFENDQSVLSSTNMEPEEEENINRSENEGNEVMDTEMVNCNEIEQIDLSENENETDLKGDNRDEEMIADSLETSCEKSSEDQMTDGREDSGDIDKSEMLISEETVNQPGNSEEETITGDTTNQPSSDLSKEKDEEVCIIPDDVIPLLSILPQNKDDMGEDENAPLTVLTATTPEMAKPKTRAQDKRSQLMDSKLRPVRNAAKLAGNKIKSLVESDLVFDEQGLKADLGGENEIQANTDESAQMCAQCREVKVCKLLSVQNDITQYLCSEQCSALFKASHMDAEPTETDSSLQEYARKCGHCHCQITIEENRLFWETMDFCNEDCLGKYQLELGSNCANCKKSVSSISLGKYCVRFGYNIKQFCSAMCLEEYKKGLKVCSYCQKDISTGAEGFLAPVGSKGQFKDFCTQSCMEKYDRMSSNKPLPEVIEECAVCSNSKPVQIEVELDNKTHKLCSEPCFAAFKFVNNITEGHCDMCRKYFDRTKSPDYSLRLLFYDENLHSFCSKTCMNVYILANRKIVRCNWCKVKKYNFDMIKKISSEGQLSMMCSLNCLMLYQTSVNAVCSRPIKCDFCKKKFVRQPLYHLTMSDASLRNFCSYNCVMSFQNGYPKQKIDVTSASDQLTSSPIPTGGPKRIAPKRQQVETTCVPVISSVQSLASPNGPVSPSGRVQRGEVNMVSQPLSVPTSPIPAAPPQVYQQIITKPAPAKEMKNKSVLCKPYSHTKGVSCRPHPCMKETQTDQSLNRKFLIPIPVPIYVPAPMHMFATPFPVPVPFPLPIPVPIFIPTTRNSAKGIMKEIKKIQEKIPTDPFEAELLMMAEMVAGDKKQDPTDSESEDGNEGDDNGDGTFSPENVDTSNTFGDDVLQMALKMASELEEPAVDMESVLTSNTITTTTQPTVDPNKALYASDDPDQVNVMAMNRGRKRSVRGSRNSSGGTPSKRGRRTSGSVDVPLLPPPEPVPPRTIEVEKPDANMCLKYTFGVNAWRHWVMQKNAELEKAALTNRKIKLFKPELLQLTADELNFSLCLFVKEVRKPNGTEYAPDTIYYLCLGIQQYLFENGRIDNIFTDSYYEKFTDCLDEVAKKFAALYNDSQYIVTRVEEEHLWESKQLGAHSPHVLLSTLMFFNTKHFNLVTVEEHMQLSFSHIMKHWKRNPNTPGVAKVPGSRNVLLRFYPPQSALEANSRKKKVYEQQENEENPLRCPVKLYEFYLSKCPESVKTRNDVFYLLPERSCVPDSPVWYSTMALGKEPLMKMLHRIKMVKEINIALLTS